MCKCYSYFWQFYYSKNNITKRPIHLILFVGVEYVVENVCYRFSHWHWLSMRSLNPKTHFPIGGQSTPNSRP